MMSRRGASLTELVVALTLLAFGGTLSSRLLLQATRDMEGAELGLRAALFLAELSENGDLDGVERPAGPGILIGQGSGGGASVHYEPPHNASTPPAGTGGFFVPRRWTLHGEMPGL